MNETEQTPSQEPATIQPMETPATVQPEPTIEPPVEPSRAEIPIQPESAPVFPPISQPPIQPPPKSFLAKALESIQFRKKAKLEKIIKLANEKKVITNDDVEKFLHVSDATATRYLNILVKQNRLKVSGNRRSARYEPINGSNGGN